MNAPLPTAASVTHVHLLACVNTQLVGRRLADDAKVRILDAGCGNGALLEHLALGLAALHPTWKVELHGYDVGDHGVQTAGFFEETIGRLQQTMPEVDWLDRLRMISMGDPWPFDAEGFDVVVSNQVLEHVVDHRHFFGEVERVLVPGGSSLHLFPLRHYVYEGHLLLPFVHRIRSDDARRQYIAALSRVGLGKFRSHHTSTGVPLDEFAERHADYINYWTNYLSEGEMLRVAAGARLRASFRYTPEFYLQKMTALRGNPPLTTYRNDNRGVLDSIAIKALRYVSSMTLTLEKINRY